MCNGLDAATDALLVAARHVLVLDLSPFDDLRYSLIADSARSRPFLASACGLKLGLLAPRRVELLMCWARRPLAEEVRRVTSRAGRPRSRQVARGRVVCLLLLSTRRVVRSSLQE